MGVGKESDMEMHGRKPLAGKPAVIVGAVAGHGVDAVIDLMKGYAGFAEMNIVGSLGAVAGMDDVRDKPEIMAQAQDLGAKLASALKK